MSASLNERALAGDAQAQYELGRQHAGRQEWSRARRYFRDAAESGHAGALTELGLLLLFGIGIPPECEQGVEMLRRAEAAGSGEAAYQLAMMSWADSLVPYDLGRMESGLVRAARGDHAPALRALALVYRRMAATDPAFDALSDACLQRAAGLGDGVSAYLLALRRRQSDPEGARVLFQYAVDHGVPRASAHLGDGPRPTGVPQVAPVPEFRPVRLAPMPLQAPRSFSESPLIETIDDVYSPEECEFIIALGEPYVVRSLTIHDTRAVLTMSDHRKSYDHSFYAFQEDFALRWLQARVLERLDVPLSNAENLVLLRYGPSDEYKPHRDYLPPSGPGNQGRPDQPGQRVHTVFSYLTDVDEGGETEFPMLGIRITPKQGRVVHFLNMPPGGECDPRTLHAGLPVRAGTKWLATLWTRERRFRPY